MADEARQTDAGDDPLAAAVRRLEHALALLDGRVKQLAGRAEGNAGGLFDYDRSKLAAELDEARARERELESAGQEASRALGQAIEHIKGALSQAGED
jgi:uncharacterized protein YPO0396